MSRFPRDPTPTSGDPDGDSPRPARHLAGAELGGRWRLVSPIGSGGMGEVWRARHVVLGRDAAVKLLTVPSPANRARILREARVLASLRHEAVVEVFDIGEHEGTPYFVMSWIDGETLSRHVERDGPLAAQEAARAFVHLLSGLAAAHRLGVIHRDVKPDNILVARADDGGVRLVLIDFGIAQLGLDSGLTATGALVGTPEYMSPEVLRGAEADERADVWGVAASLYEVSTGVSPFRRDHFVATVRAVTEDAPAPLPATTPDALASIIGRGLEKTPAARYESADSMRAALEGFLARAATLAERGHARTQAAASFTATAAAPPASATRPPVSEPAPTLDALIRERFGKS